MPKSPHYYYKSGFSLCEAWRVFAPEGLLENQHARFRENYNAPSLENTGRMEKLLIFTGEMCSLFGEHLSSKQEMKEIVSQNLQNGILIGYGKKVGQKNPHAIQAINKCFWIEAKIDWSENSAKNYSDEFSQIRVVDTQEYPELTENKKIGRPTHRDLIYSAIEILKNENEQFMSLPNKSKIDQIRKVIVKLAPGIKPDGPGLSDDTIRKHITEFKKSTK